MRKFARVLFCFLPVLLALGIQFLVTIPCTGIALLRAFLQAPEGSDLLNVYMHFVRSLTESKSYLSSVSLLYAIVCVPVFGLWYRKRFHAFSIRSLPGSFNPRILLGLLLIVPGLQYLSSYLVTFTALLHPQWLKNYEQLFEQAGLTDISLVMSIYAVVIGPISEELIFRGVTLSYARREMPFFAANIFQAALFGLYHMNVIQGVYAFFIALFFGYVFFKTGSIFPTMLLHILFNAWGIFASELFVYKQNTPFFFLLWFVAGIALTAAGSALVASGSKLLNRGATTKVLRDSSDI